MLLTTEEAEDITVRNRHDAGTQDFLAIMATNTCFDSIVTRFPNIPLLILHGMYNRILECNKDYYRGVTI
jgi:hypothetical protein